MPTKNIAFSTKLFFLFFFLASTEDNKQANGTNSGAELDSQIQRAGTQLHREDVRIHRGATSRLGLSRNKKEPNESNAQSNIIQYDRVIPLCLTLHVQEIREIQFCSHVW